MRIRTGRKQERMQGLLFRFDNGDCQIVGARATGPISTGHQEQEQGKRASGSGATRLRTPKDHCRDAKIVHICDVSRSGKRSSTFSSAGIHLSMRGWLELIVIHLIHCTFKYYNTINLHILMKIIIEFISGRRALLELLTANI